MNQPRIVAFLLAACVCTAALPPAAAQEAGTTSQGPLPDAALAFPSEYGMLVGFHVRAIVESAEYKDVVAGRLPGVPLEPEQQSQLAEGFAKGLAEFEKESGLDPERDIDRVVVAVGGFGEKDPDLLVMVIGRLEASRVTEAFAADAGDATLASKTLHGRTLHLQSRKGKPEVGLVLLDAATLVYGSAAAVEATLASHAAKQRSLAANASLMGLVQGLDPAASVWIAVGPTATAVMREKAGPNPPPVPIPDSMTLAGAAGGGFDAVLQMPDAGAANNAADVMRGGLAMMKMQLAQQAAEAGPAVDTTPLDRVTIGAQGRQLRISSPASGGPGAFGMLAAIAIPSLLRARVAANESMAIGDTRTLISAQAAYASVGQGYGELACLAKPKDCMRDYKGPFFLDEQLASLSPKSGYARAFHPGPAGPKPRSFESFAYTATPLEPGRSGGRSFCGDSTGRICFDPSGAEIVPQQGACPASCQEL